MLQDVLFIIFDLNLAATSPKPLTRAEHERRVSARLTRGVAPEVDLPKRLGASAGGLGGGTASRYRDMSAAGASASGFSGIPRGGASKDADGLEASAAVQRSMKQPKK